MGTSLKIKVIKTLNIFVLLNILPFPAMFYLIVRKKLTAGAFVFFLLFVFIQFILCQHISGNYQAFCGCMCLLKGSCLTQQNNQADCKKRSRLSLFLWFSQNGLLNLRSFRIFLRGLSSPLNA